MFLLGALAVLAAAIFGSEWLIDVWLGEALRYWMGFAGLGVLLLATVLIHASGVHEVMRLLRRLVIGAGIGAALKRFGLKLPLLRRVLRLFGIETEPEAGKPSEVRWSLAGNWLFVTGGIGELVGMGMIWTGWFAG